LTRGKITIEMQKNNHGTTIALCLKLNRNNNGRNVEAKPKKKKLRNQLQHGDLASVSRCRHDAGVSCDKNGR
jgi:hypothetical protein